ncbi:MAG: hypothetical protein ACE5F9_14320, partial [Phycisphaerae bacterium]
MRSCVMKIVVVLSLSCLALPATGQVTLVTGRAALGGTDGVDWGALGPVGTMLSSSFAVTSSGGVPLGVSKGAPIGFRRVDQFVQWAGNFAPGDRLIRNLAPAGRMFIDFPEPVFGGGVQVQRAMYGSFTATIEAFDVNGVSLGSFSEPGFSDNGGDNSAMFIGVKSSTADISRIALDVDPGSGLAYGINQFDLVLPP